MIEVGDTVLYVENAVVTMSRDLGIVKDVYPDGKTLKVRFYDNLLQTVERDQVRKLALGDDCNVCLGRQLCHGCM